MKHNADMAVIREITTFFQFLQLYLKNEKMFLALAICSKSFHFPTVRAFYCSL